MATGPDIRIVLVHDEALFRDVLTRAIDREPGLRAVGAAPAGAEAIRLTRQLEPDVLLLDLAPDGTGAVVLRGLLAEPGSRARIIVLAGEEDRSTVLGALESGARGAVTKASGTAVLFECIRTVAQGDYWVGDRHLSELVHAVRQLQAPAPAALPARTGRLTPRERQIVGYVTDGFTNKDIASRCAVREDTVKHHLSRIFVKLGVRSRLELAMLTRRRDQVPPREQAS